MLIGKLPNEIYYYPIFPKKNIKINKRDFLDFYKKVET